MLHHQAPEVHPVATVPHHLLEWASFCFLLRTPLGVWVILTCPDTWQFCQHHSTPAPFPFPPTHSHPLSRAPPPPQPPNTRRWYVPPSAGPSVGSPSTQLWVYRSTLDPVKDTQAGLAGPLVVARPGTLNAEGLPSDVDRELYLMLQVQPGLLCVELQAS
jgi:hypothetical protein